ncbi:hypothetical protein S7711_10621 [Stachybotrys chartarum IBT 7711]|uniref:Uncharacterized protein n=1 Tax=Stachybotrys chartarum (strain CBS 109288 / IBT 7711) TaxID=1280523 RepID=A0A084AZ45_STACB|nr:hypothetical protein S7711_10621 [Stachybotrys chartarum IBT 7711]
MAKTGGSTSAPNVKVVIGRPTSFNRDESSRFEAAVKLARIESEASVDSASFGFDLGLQKSQILHETSACCGRVSLDVVFETAILAYLQTTLGESAHSISQLLQSGIKDQWDEGIVDNFKPLDVNWAFELQIPGRRIASVTIHRDMILDVFRTVTKPIVGMICELYVKMKARGVQPTAVFLTGGLFFNTAVFHMIEHGPALRLDGCNFTLKAAHNTPEVGAFEWIHAGSRGALKCVVLFILLTTNRSCHSFGSFTFGAALGIPAPPAVEDEQARPVGSKTILWLVDRRRKKAWELLPHPWPARISTPVSPDAGRGQDPARPKHTDHRPRHLQVATPPSHPRERTWGESTPSQCLWPRHPQIMDGGANGGGMGFLLVEVTHEQGETGCHQGPFAIGAFCYHWHGVPGPPDIAPAPPRLADRDQGAWAAGELRQGEHGHFSFRLLLLLFSRAHKVQASPVNLTPSAAPPNHHLCSSQTLASHPPASRSAPRAHSMALPDKPSEDPGQFMELDDDDDETAARRASLSVGRLLARANAIPARIASRLFPESPAGGKSKGQQISEPVLVYSSNILGANPATRPTRPTSASTVGFRDGRNSSYSERSVNPRTSGMSTNASVSPANFF